MSASAFEIRLIWTGGTWWAYQIIRRCDGMIVAGGECNTQRRARFEARGRLASLIHP